jgi:hypothetical protein
MDANFLRVQIFVKYSKQILTNLEFKIQIHFTITKKKNTVVELLNFLRKYLIIFSLIFGENIINKNSNREIIVHKDTKKLFITIIKLCFYLQRKIEML